MILRSMAAGAAGFLILCAAQAAPEDGLASEVIGCSALPDGSAQLACYNRIAARLKASVSPQTSIAPAPAVQASPAPQAPAQLQAVASSTPRPVLGTPEDFGKEGLRFQAEMPAELDHITARVATVTVNYFHFFTVTLDNGQVWRQVDGDTRVARFKNDRTEIVTITRGFLDSFHLAIQGAWGDYEVKRIK